MQVQITGQPTELETLFLQLLGQSLNVTLKPSEAAAKAADAPKPTDQRYTKLGANGILLMNDSQEHSFLIDRQAGLIFDVRCEHRGDQASCMKYAEQSSALDHEWRLPTVLELFTYVSDRTRCEPALNPDLFPKIKTEWVWSADPDVSDSSCAWGVDLLYGLANLYRRAYHGLALPVAALRNAE